MNKSNVEKIQELMTRSPAGPLMQAFILEAVRRYSEDIINEGVPEDNPRALISPKAWYTCAEVAHLELS
jgi:GH35 family endo-1,4-beta-xylanase